MSRESREPSREPIERWLGPAIDDARIDAAWAKLDGQRGARPRRSRTRAVVWLGGALAVAAAVALYLTSRGGAAPVTPFTGVVLETAVPRHIALADHAALELSAGARIHVLAEAPDRVIAALPRGRIELVPPPAQRWEIATPRATIDVAAVAATQVVIAADERRVFVEVIYGTVIVRGPEVPGGRVELAAGEQLVVPASSAPIATTAVADLPPPSPVPAAAIAQPRPREGDGPDVHAGSAAGGASDGALPLGSAADSAAGSDALPVPALANVAALLASADRLRAASDLDGAKTALESAVAAATDPESRGLALFALGRLELDELSDPEGAAVAFAGVITQNAPRSLLEDAHAHRIEALVRARRPADAAAALADYDRAFPAGVHRAMLHRLVGAR